MNEPPLADRRAHHDFHMAAEYTTTPVFGDTFTRTLTDYYLFECTCGAQATGKRAEVKPVLDRHIAQFVPNPT